ncbi:MAG TPA: hypothetical protein VN310_02855 [Candidatus Dormibacteraeota bacterium]|nr:hypothetical protein [Candidatus Dormibacteraeota bacterium]
MNFATSGCTFCHAIKYVAQTGFHDHRGSAVARTVQVHAVTIHLVDPARRWIAMLQGGGDSEVVRRREHDRSRKHG